MNDIPKKLAKYEIIEELGRGSMGIVYGAYDPVNARNVALKVTYKVSDSNREAKARIKKAFFNEANTASKLNHPNIVKTIDAGIEDNAYFIVMEWIEGANTLEVYCEPDSLLPYDTVAEITSKCSMSLDYAHRVGIVHRDIKPKNILITDDMDIKICDFSIAHVISGDVEDTLPTGFVGSPRYMAPEQIQEGTITVQTDFFPLGIILYQLLTGRYPFEARGFSQLIYKIINEEPAPMDHYRKDIPPIFKRIVSRMLKKPPRQRYKMGADIVADLNLAFDSIDKSVGSSGEEKQFAQISGLSCFRNFTEIEIWEIIRVFRLDEYEKGAEIPLHRRAGKSLFLVISGGVDIYRDERHITCIREDKFFSINGKSFGGADVKVICGDELTRLMQINDTMLGRLSSDCQMRFNKIFLHTLIDHL